MLNEKYRKLGIQLDKEFMNSTVEDTQAKATLPRRHAKALAVEVTLSWVLKAE